MVANNQLPPRRNDDTLHYPMKHCPECLAVRPKVLRSQDQGDGSIRQSCICRECGHRFYAVLEPPKENFSEIDCQKLADAAREARRILRD